MQKLNIIIELSLYVISCLALARSLGLRFVICILRIVNECVTEYYMIWFYN